MPSEYVNRASEMMGAADPALARPFACVIAFLEDNPESANARLPKFGTEAFLEKAVKRFADDRKNKRPKCPETVSDPMIGFILNKFWKIDEQAISTAIQHHNFSMGAENIIGHLLEGYIALNLEPHGWAWCSGSLVKAVDFVHQDPDGSWIALQVKNRDNSENSSSSKVRVGTEIKKWFRTYSKKPGSNWAAFPQLVGEALSEEGFQAYVYEYLRGLN